MNMRTLSDKYSRALDLLKHMRRHKMMVNAVSAPVFDGIRTRQPKLARKYLNPRHLVQGMSSADRVIAMTHHYRKIQTCFKPKIQSAILGCGAILWKRVVDLDRDDITLKFSHPTDNEGELTLEYARNNQVMYTVAFTLVPGNLFGLEGETVLLLTRMQGSRTVYKAIRDTMKSLHGLALPSLLMAAIEGFMKNICVDHIIGVPAIRQVSHVEGLTDFAASYDCFFLEIGAERIADFYVMTMPFIDRPISGIKSSNRKRVRAQRELKKQVNVSVTNVLEETYNINSV